jgi:hypothetical protein
MEREVGSSRQIQKEELAALQRFIQRSTVPMLVETGEGQFFLQGTGTLFRINNRHFIVSARHVFESNVDLLSNLALPDGVESNKSTRILDAVNAGASIWELDQTGQAEPWLPERFVKAVGVQSSFSRGNYIRGKSWFAVVNLLAKIDDELKEAISARWGIARDARDIH